jgi:predicted RNA-binding Zn ribbon-like protein
VLQDPGQRQRAPQPLRLVQEFVNTVDIENGVEELASAEHLGTLLARLGLGVPDLRLGDRDLRDALEVREALRQLLLGNNGLPVPDEAFATLERAARAGHLALRFEEGGARLVAEAPGLDGVLGTLVAIVFTAMENGTWPRLKACRRDVCHWVYYDRSRNRSSTWCAMSVCGNRTKTRRYRRRSARAT